MQQQAAANLAQGIYSCFGTDGHGIESLEAFLLLALKIATNPQGGSEILGSKAGSVGVVKGQCDTKTRTLLKPN